jgi:hypothetical protein
MYDSFDEEDGVAGARAQQIVSQWVPSCSEMDWVVRRGGGSHQVANNSRTVHVTKAVGRPRPTVGRVERTTALLIHATL